MCSDQDSSCWYGLCMQLEDEGWDPKSQARDQGDLMILLTVLNGEK